MRIFTTTLLCFFVFAAIPLRAQDQVIPYSEKNHSMNDAIAHAQQTLPLFFAQYYEDYEDSGEFLALFSVKVEMTTSDGIGSEHIWVSPFVRTSENEFFGLLANEPEDLKNLSYGSEVTFTVDQISDWSYSRDDRAFGNFTTRVMLPDLSPEMAAQVRGFLSAEPLPADWQP